MHIYLAGVILHLLFLSWDIHVFLKTYYLLIYLFCFLPFLYSLSKRSHINDVYMYILYLVNYMLCKYVYRCFMWVCLMDIYKTVEELVIVLKLFLKTRVILYTLSWLSSLFPHLWKSYQISGFRYHIRLSHLLESNFPKSRASVIFVFYKTDRNIRVNILILTIAWR